MSADDTKGQREGKARGSARPVLLSAAAALAVFVALLVVWRWPAQLPRDVPDAVRNVPRLDAQPQALRQRLLAAQAQARSPTGRADGIADMARLYHENGQLPEAEACWLYLIRTQPAEPRWPYYLADLHRLSGRDDELEPLLAKTVELAPDYSPAVLRLADLYFKTARFAEAGKLYQRRLEQLPADPHALLGLARIAQQQGDLPAARARLEEILRTAPTFSPARNLFAEMLAAAGDADGARRERWLGREAGRFREADDPWLTELHAACLDPKRLGVLGAIEYQTGHGPQALAYFERALELAPSDPTNYEVLGSFYRKLDQPARAREILEAGLRLSSSGRPSAALFVELSQTFRALHQPREALATVERGLAAAELTSELHNAHGVALSDLRRYDEAIAAYDRALAVDPGDATFNYNRAVSLLALHRDAEARLALQRSLVLQPTFADSLRLLGALELEADNLPAAAVHLQPLYAANPGLPDVQHLMAQWHLQAAEQARALNEPAAAETEYRRGVAIEPIHPGLQVGLGTLYLQEGRYADSVSPLESYHSLEPDNPQSALYLGQAYARVGRTDEARRVLQAGEALAKRIGRVETAAHCRQVLDTL